MQYEGYIGLYRGIHRDYIGLYAQPNPANRTKEHLFQGGYLFQIASRTELYCAIHEAGSRGLRKVWGGGEPD